MIIGLPKEVKDSENRVGLIPGAVKVLTRRGHQVLVEAGAGLGSAIADDEYEDAGGTGGKGCASFRQPPLRYQFETRYARLQFLNPLVTLTIFHVFSPWLV